MPDATLQTLAEEYWNALLEAVPTAASVLGDHRFDDRIEDLSRDGEIRLRARWESFANRLAAIDAGRLDLEDRVTYRQLSAELYDAMALIDQRLAELQSDQMTGYHVGLLQSLPVMSAPDPESARMLLERFSQVPEALDQAARRFLEGLSAGRPPAAICVSRSLNVIEGYLASPLDADVFVTLPGPNGWVGDREWHAALRGLATDVIRPAYRQMADVLRGSVLPRARDDDHCGLAWLEEGADIYRTLIRQHTSLNLSPEEIHQIGMAEVTEKLPAEYAAVGGRRFGISDPAAVLDRLRTDPALRYSTGEEMMDDARRSFEAAMGVMADWFGRLPAASCTIEPVPAFLAADSPAAYYYPPPVDGSRGGTYYVNTDSPGEKARYETASVAFHEAIPGHHLQLAIASELTDLPRFRRFSLANTAYVEGWGLYAERLAEEMGLYADDLERLGMLANDSMRACRLVVDTGLHHYGWTRAQAIEFMAANTPVSVDEVTIEVDRYIGMPGQAVAYKLGQREIFRLRESARKRLGERFDIKGFHDAVLGSGAVSLPVLAELVESWVTRSGGRGGT